MDLPTGENHIEKEDFEFWSRRTLRVMYFSSDPRTRCCFACQVAILPCHVCARFCPGFDGPVDLLLRAFCFVPYRRTVPLPSLSACAGSMVSGRVLCVDVSRPILPSRAMSCRAMSCRARRSTMGRAGSASGFRRAAAW